MRKHITQSEAPDAIRARREFKASGLSGRIVDAYNTLYGDLPDEWQERFRQAYRDSRHDRRLYAVFSFETPIAWMLGDVLTFPEVRYSPTTTQHQQIAAQGFDLDPVRPWMWPRVVPVDQYAGRSWQSREWGWDAR